MRRSPPGGVPLPAGPSGGANTRFVVLPLAGRSGRYASRGRDASLLLGYGAAVFPPGTTFTVHDRHSDGGVDTIVLVETPAAVAGPVRLEDVLPVTGPGALGLNESLHRSRYLGSVEAELAWWQTLTPAQRQAEAAGLWRGWWMRSTPG